MSSRSVFTAFLAGLAVTATVAAAQHTLRVPSQYKTIQAAINAAQNSDTIRVAPGVYRERNIDFKGKTLTLESSGGPHVTTIDATIRPSGWPVIASISNNSVLDGFTITGGVWGRGGGITCGHATIRNNIVVNNYAYDGGGGIYVVGNARIENNVVMGNTIGQGGGDGIWVNGSSATIVGNILALNHQLPYHGRSCIYLYFSAKTVMSNDTLYGNVSGLVMDYSSATIENCIFWGNNNSEVFVGYCASPATTLSIAYSDIQGGTAGVRVYAPGPQCKVNFGPGILNADPRFADPANGDFHLLPPLSPCAGKGTNTASGLSATDFEGDPRIVGGTVDIGADEIFPHLYHVGNPTPGGTIDVKLVGQPNDPAYWAFAGGTLAPPIPIPGLQGALHLNPGNLFLIPLGRIPANGVLGFPVAFPSTFPKVSIPTQALIGIRLSNLEVVAIR